MIAQDLRTETQQWQHYTSVKARLGKSAPASDRGSVRADRKVIAWGAPIDMLSAPSWKFLVKLSCLRHHETLATIMGRSRQKSVVAARHEAIVLIATHTRRGPTDIGRLFNLDHTTTIAALKKFGKFNPRRRISQEEGDLIMRLREEGWTHKAIGERLGWGRASVQSYHYWRSHREGKNA